MLYPVLRYVKAPPLMIGCHDAPAYHDSADSSGNCRKTAHFRQFLVQQIKTNSKTTWVSEATCFVIEIFYGVPPLRRL
jgi:hypothetical protein